MGCGDSETHVSTWNDQTQTTTLKDASAEELAYRKQIGDLGGNQTTMLNDFMRQAQSGSAFSMLPQDQLQLDTAYDAARNRMAVEGKDYADFLSGGRGLRMSDTPVAQQALDRYGLGMADLQGQRAMAGLNLGLAANQFRTNQVLGLSQALPAGSVFGHNTLFNERLAQPTTHTLGHGGSNTQVMPSLLTQFQQGAGAFKDVAQGISSLYGGGGPLMK